MPDENSLHLNMLLQSLQLLAASYQQQVKAFPDFVHIPDEIALVFDDVYLFVDNLTEKGFINPKQRKELEQVDALLSIMSSDKALWAVKKLEDAPEWENLRKLSKILLVSFDEKEHLPHLFWIKYV